MTLLTSVYPWLEQISGKCHFAEAHLTSFDEDDQPSNNLNHSRRAPGLKKNTYTYVYTWLPVFFICEGSSPHVGECSTRSTMKNHSPHPLQSRSADFGEWRRSIVVAVCTELCSATAGRVTSILCDIIFVVECTPFI